MITETDFAFLSEFYSPETFLAHAVQLAERPQCFHSYATGAHYNVQRGWQHAVQALKGGTSEIGAVSLHADERDTGVDVAYANELTKEQCGAPILAVHITRPDGLPALHIIDGRHRAFRLAVLGAGVCLAVILSDEQAEDIRFKSEEELAAYQLAAVAADPSILEHDLRRLSRLFNTTPEVLRQVYEAAMRGDRATAVAVMVAHGIDPEAFIREVS